LDCPDLAEFLVFPPTLLPLLISEDPFSQIFFRDLFCMLVVSYCSFSSALPAVLCVTGYLIAHNSPDSGEVFVLDILLGPPNFSEVHFFPHFWSSLARSPWIFFTLRHASTLQYAFENHRFLKSLFSFKASAGHFAKKFGRSLPFAFVLECPSSCAFASYKCLSSVFFLSPECGRVSFFTQRSATFRPPLSDH